MSIPLVAALLASAALIVWLARRVAAGARRLDEGIEDYWKEREAQGPIDPYAELSGLFADRDRKGTPDK